MEDINYHKIRTDLITIAIQSGIARDGIIAIIAHVETYLNESRVTVYMKNLAEVYTLLRNLPEDPKTQDIRARLQPQAFERDPPTINDIINMKRELKEYQACLANRADGEKSRNDVQQLEARIRKVHIKIGRKAVTLSLGPRDILILPRTRSHSKPN